MRGARALVLLHLLLSRPVHVVDGRRPRRATPAGAGGVRRRVGGPRARHRRTFRRLHTHLHVQKVLSRSSELFEIPQSIGSPFSQKYTLDVLSVSAYADGPARRAALRPSSCTQNGR